nr:peptidyl-tRNA hydrolase [Microbacterium sp. 77mftsu3.1]
MYLVTNQQLSSGYQAAQIAHVAAEFVLEHPDIASRWTTLSNSLIVLTAPNVASLTELTEKARARGIVVTVFREPDLGDEITAVAFAPSDQTRRLLSNLPCAGRGVTTETEAAAKAREARLREMAFAMMDCDQTPGQNVLQHGRSVREHYFALVDHLQGHVNLAEHGNWRIPAWLDAHRNAILPTLPSRHTMGTYLTLHDAGKPAVLEVGEDGRRHFPGHAESSERVYREAFADEADETIAWLIAHDMDIHLLRADGIPAFCEQPLAIAQLLAGLAEVTSNAAMFGGIDSDGFKMKFKRLDQRGRAICKRLFGEV